MKSKINQARLPITTTVLSNFIRPLSIDSGEEFFYRSFFSHGCIITRIAYICIYICFVTRFHHPDELRLGGEGVVYRDIER